MQTSLYPLTAGQNQIKGLTPGHSSESTSEVQVVKSQRTPLKTEHKTPEAVTANRKNKSLTPEIVALLGTVSDRQLAKKTGRPESTIRTARVKRGISTVTVQSRHLDSQTLKALGTMKDAELARQSGRPESSIRSARIRRGIPRFAIPSLDTDTQADLGKLSDKDLAWLSGRSESIIRSARMQLGIPKFGSPNIAGKARSTNAGPLNGEVLTAPKWLTTSKFIFLHGSQNPTLGFVKPPFSPNQPLRRRIERPALDHNGLQLLTWASDSAIAKQLGISVWTVGKLRAEHGIPGLRLRYEPPHGLIESLGKMEDLRVADLFKVQVKWVRKLRKKLSIQSYRSQSQAKLNIPKEALALLGKVSDRSLEKKFGLFAGAYRQAREERGIAPFQPKDLRNYAAELDNGLKILLGWASDSEVKRQTGLSFFKIKKFRKAHDIPLLGLKQRPPLGLLDAIGTGKVSETVLANRFATTTAKIKEIKAKLELSAARQHQT